MLCFVLNWFALSLLAAGYLIKRLPRDYAGARYAVVIRCIALRTRHAFRDMQRLCLKHSRSW